MLDRVVVPSRLALIYRSGATLAYNPALNTWESTDDDTAEVLRWLRAKRERAPLETHLARRFAYTIPAAKGRLQKILAWCIFRRLLYLDREPQAPEVSLPPNPLETVYWICTQACNLRCAYCYQDATIRRPQELSTEEGKDLVDQVVEAGADTFIFTGGEPFARHDLLEIARYSRARGLRTNVITNGHYITPRNVTEIGHIFDTVTISLDHGIPEHHDRNRGPGSWQRAVDAIDLLLKVGVNVDVNSVLSRFGLKDIKELVRFIRARPVGELRIIPQFPMGRGASAREEQIAPGELIGLNDLLQRAGSDLEQQAQTRVSPEGTYSTKRVIRSHCGAGLSEVSVDPEGWVYPCKLLQYGLFRTDNVRLRRLVDIYTSHAVLRQIRGTMASTLHPCKTCIIKNHCGGGCRGIQFSFTQDYIKAHPLFCAYLRATFEVQAWAATGKVPRARRTGFNQLATDHQPGGGVKADEWVSGRTSFIPITNVKASNDNNKEECASAHR